MNDTNKVSMLVNGTSFSGWKEISITAGIERLARDFSLAVTDRWPSGQAGGFVTRRIRPGDVCEVFIGTDRVLTGYVDATPVSYDAQTLRFSVEGRSKTADLVDCSAINSPGQWRNRKIESIAADLVATYGIKLHCDTDTGPALKDFQIQQGESVAESLDRLLRVRHLLASDNEAGDLVIRRVGAGKTATAIAVGGERGNVLSGDFSFDVKDRFSEYICKGQRSGDDASYGEDVAGETARNTDTSIKRKRVLLMKQSGQADEGTCRDRVDYERAVRAGKSLSATYTVHGWRSEDGALWTPNAMVHVIDPLAGFDREMLIAEVEYRLNENGMVSVIHVGPEAAFQPSAWKPSDKKSKGAGNSVSGVDQWIDFTSGIQ